MDRIVKFTGAFIDEAWRLPKQVMKLIFFLSSMLEKQEDLTNQFTLRVRVVFGEIKKNRVEEIFKEALTLEVGGVKIFKRLEYLGVNTGVFLVELNPDFGKYFFGKDQITFKYKELMKLNKANSRALHVALKLVLEDLRSKDEPWIIDLNSLCDLTECNEQIRYAPTRLANDLINPLHKYFGDHIEIITYRDDKDNFKICAYSLELSRMAIKNLLS